MSGLANVARLILVASSCIALAPRASLAQTTPPPAVKQPVEPGRIAVELDGPSALAVQPETDAVFVAEGKTGRVVRIAGFNREPVLTDIPTSSRGEAADELVVPTSLFFLDKQHLAVGTEAIPAGSPQTWVLTLPEAGQPAMKATDLKSGIKLADANLKAKGPTCLVATKLAAFATMRTEDGRDLLLRSLTNSEWWVDWKPFVPLGDFIGSERPGALAISPQGDLVVAQRGGTSDQADCVIAFFNANSGKLLLHHPVALLDIVGMAFSPKTGNLYALDFAAARPADGGLYQLISQQRDGKLSVAAVKIASLQRPTALGFTSDGQLFVTVLGTGKAGELYAFRPGL